MIKRINLSESGVVQSPSLSIVPKSPHEYNIYIGERSLISMAHISVLGGDLRKIHFVPRPAGILDLHHVAIHMGFIRSRQDQTLLNYNIANYGYLLRTISLGGINLILNIFYPKL